MVQNDKKGLRQWYFPLHINAVVERLVIDHWTKSGENQDPVKYVLNKLTGNFGHLALTENNLSPTLITIVQH